MFQILNPVWEMDEERQSQWESYEIKGNELITFDKTCVCS